MQHDSIGNIYRAGVSCQLGETLHSMGDDAKALEVYRRAVEEGLVNPNSRPRADDLALTCCSMARTSVEPDEQLWKRLNQIRTALGEPW